ncbi:hypothetical protein BH23PLA1_BH23PLA1_10820 [soil metagenome]
MGLSEGVVRPMSMSLLRQPGLAAGLALCLLLVGSSATRAQPAPVDRGAAGAPMEEESFLRWMYRASGPIGWVILSMSFYMIALVAWMSFEYRRSKALPNVLIREINEHLLNKRYTQAYDRLAHDPSFLARVLAAGVRRLPQGQPSAMRSMQMVNDDVTMEMEHRTTYLSTVGTLGPLIGLLGTVYGMIIAFRVMSSAGTTEASQLAGGISTALFATLEGIAVAIPAITFYAIFRNRIARLSLEVELAAETLLEQFVPGVRPPHPLATMSGPPRSALGGPPKEE